MLGVGRQDTTGDTLVEKIIGAIKNQAGTTTLISTDTVRIDDAGAAAWDISVAADDADDELAISVTGEAAHTIDWKVSVTIIEV